MSSPEARWEARVDELIRAGRTPEHDELVDIEASQSPTLGVAGAARLVDDLRARTHGFGPLQEVIDRGGITDLLVNADGTVWTDSPAGLIQLAEPRMSVPALRELAIRLAGTAGRRLDESSPWVDGLLPGGVRLHAILPPLATDGPHIALRLPAHSGASLEALAATGMFDAEQWAQLREVVAQRRSFLISGGTGTGKTTLLAAMLALVPLSERTVIVEDVSELVIAHPHTVRLQSRPANVEGTGHVDLATLIRQALRMRPDRIVVGEVRGGEVREMLQALNTGHEGGGATVHANAVRDIPARLLALGALAGLSDHAVDIQARSAIDVIIHLERVGARRRISQIVPAQQVWR